jgi:hypothetical protein
VPTHDHSAHEPPRQGNFLGSRAGIALFAFLAIAGYFLWTEHNAHVIAALPWLFLLACPFIHLFMHGGHHRHHGRGPDRGGGGT